MENNEQTEDVSVPHGSLMEALFKNQVSILTLNKHQIHIVNNRYVLIHLQQEEITYIDTFDNLQAAVNGYLVDAQVLP